MDWYLCNGMEDLVVPRNQELEDNIPSPESWSKWEFSPPENFNDECFGVDTNLSGGKPKFSGKLCPDVAGVKDPSTCSSVYGGFLNQGHISQQQTDYQLHDFGRFEQLDDIFLGSLLEDPTWSEDLQKSFCFSPEYECEMMATDHVLEDASFAKILVPPEQITANGLVSKGMSLEESVLKELEKVTAQLSDKTRICFRDAFYRLAKNSKQNPVALNQQGNLHVRTHSPKWTISEEKIRQTFTTIWSNFMFFSYVKLPSSGPELHEHGTLGPFFFFFFFFHPAMCLFRHFKHVLGRKIILIYFFRSGKKETTESETNTIDRTIANLTFDKMDMNVRDFPVCHTQQL